AGDDNLEYGSMSALANGDGIPANSASVDLIAGRTEDVGDVTCWIKGDNLFVLYSMNMGWKLAETQLVAAGSIIDIDRTKKGNPKIGHFPWKTEHEIPVVEYLYSIALDELEFEYTGEMVIAAHAAVLLYSEEGAVEREEGAWAYGDRFVGAETQYADRVEKPEYSKDAGSSHILEIASVDKGNWSMYFTIVGWQITVRELLINEIFYAGSDYSSYYFYDQFVELYNTSENTLYLDGCIITRNYSTVLPDIEDIDYVRAIYAFQFPGTPVTGREYPIEPGQHVVVAADAIDHSLYANNAVDLSGADWEFFNPLGSDWDNPDVPNVVSIHPTKTTDYMINLLRNAVVLATGEEYWYETYTSAGSEKIRIAIPLYTVLDGVEYSNNTSSTKQLTVRLDEGFAGLGNSKYSAQSVERMTPGLDSNNSSNDFRLVGPPSPGYQSP
ncbi:MAG: hypothetical protein DRP08_04675, partial [Candidatus Aenigmatarchaeota archaeon]